MTIFRRWVGIRHIFACWLRLCSSHKLAMSTTWFMQVLHKPRLYSTRKNLLIIFVFLLENLPKKHRMWINAVISWSPNFALFAIIAYLSGNWRILARATSTITVPAILLSLFIYESPRWLIQKRRMNEASEVLKKIIMFNGDRHISNENISTVISNENASIAVSGRKENFYVYHLFCTKRLILYTFVFSFSYASTSIINYGIFFNMGKLPGSVYANNIFIGLTSDLRWVINASVGFVDYKVKWFGRKMLHTLSLLSILLAVITVFMLTQFEKSKLSEMFEQYATLIRVSVLSISIMSSHLYIGNNVSTNELYPTPIRNVAFSFMQVVNRIGVAIAPQLFVLVCIYHFNIAAYRILQTADFWTAAPYFAMFLLAGTDLLLCQLLIPESKGRTLEDSMPSSKRRLFSSKNAANKEDNFKYTQPEFRLYRDRLHQRGRLHHPLLRFYCTLRGFTTFEELP
ncbi:unnamed protein product [Anisakis simplex]|uniref:Uncharacterized protein n=1 Tax=Anisakis simplex TaxID=6269 RepID=A0A3P6QHK7_ANISI|nr:unnamed protein product [Anisakis simplex]